MRGWRNAAEERLRAHARRVFGASGYAATWPVITALVESPEDDTPCSLAWGFSGLPGWSAMTLEVLPAPPSRSLDPLVRVGALNPIYRDHPPKARRPGTVG